jgi:hypothetical protein
MPVNTFSVTIDNAMIDGQTVKPVHELAKREFTISRICRPGARTTRRLSTDIPCCMWATRCSWWHALPTGPLCALLGTLTEMDWEQFGNTLITPPVLLTRSVGAGKSIAQLTSAAASASTSPACTARA